MAAVAVAAVLGVALGRSRTAEKSRSADGSPQIASTRFYQGAALVSFSVFADSALEHYRGRYKNPAMFIAPTIAFASLAAAALAQADRKLPGRDVAFATALATGAAGTLFHIYNVAKREGAFDWVNVMYGAPLGAPAAIAVAGLFGLAAGQIEASEGDTGEGQMPSALATRALGGRSLGALTAAALLGTSAEVSLLHFRGAYQNPFMYVPITAPPAAAAAIFAAAYSFSPAKAAVARLLLGTSAAAGAAGVGFHAYGIARNMGGWKNWSQMVQQGPPLPAPPSFTGIALAGFGAIRLMEAHDGR